MRFNFIGVPRLENFAAAATIFPIRVIDQRRHEAELRSRQRDGSYLKAFRSTVRIFRFTPNVPRKRPEPINLTLNFADVEAIVFQRETQLLFRES